MTTGTVVVVGGGNAAFCAALSAVEQGASVTLLERAPEAFPTLARAARVAEHGLSVAVILGSGADAQALADRARRLLAPEDGVLVCEPGAAPPQVDPTWLAGREAQGGKATAYVCRGTTCSLPVTDPGELAPLETAAHGVSP